MDKIKIIIMVAAFLLFGSFGLSRAFKPVWQQTNYFSLEKNHLAQGQIRPQEPDEDEDEDDDEEDEDDEDEDED